MEIEMCSDPNPNNMSSSTSGPAMGGLFTAATRTPTNMTITKVRFFTIDGNIGKLSNDNLPDFVRGLNEHRHPIRELVILDACAKQQWIQVVVAQLLSIRKCCIEGHQTSQTRYNGLERFPDLPQEHCLAASGVQLGNHNELNILSLARSFLIASHEEATWYNDPRSTGVTQTVLHHVPNTAPLEYVNLEDVQIRVNAFELENCKVHQLSYEAIRKFVAARYHRDLPNGGGRVRCLRVLRANLSSSEVKSLQEDYPEVIFERKKENENQFWKDLRVLESNLHYYNQPIVRHSPNIALI